MSFSWIGLTSWYSSTVKKEYCACNLFLTEGSFSRVSTAILREYLKVKESFLVKLFEIDFVGIPKAIWECSFVNPSSRRISTSLIKVRYAQFCLLPCLKQIPGMPGVEWIEDIIEINIMLTNWWKKGKSSYLIKHIIGPVSWNEVLKDLKCESVNRANVHIPNIWLLSKQLLNFGLNPEFQLFL